MISSIRFGMVVAAVAGVLFAYSQSVSAAPIPTGGQFDDPHFFPLTVWLQSPRNAPEFQALGINLFLGLWKGPTEEQLSVLARNNMATMTEQNDVGLSSSNNSVIKGWTQSDEPDNAQPNGHGGYGPCIPAADIAARTSAIKSRDPKRPVLVGFGQGVANPGWIGRGSCHGDMEYYRTAAQGADIVAFDIYPVANDQPAIQGKLEYVGRGVDALVARTKPGQRVWTTIETTFIDSKHLVTPDQLRSEVWMAIIHGATGIDYFVHEWTNGFREDGIFRHPEIVAAVTKINQEILSLAPVLNSPSQPQLASTSTPSIRTMAKRQDKTLYLFAVSDTNDPTEASFSVPGTRSGSASVLDEGRTVMIANGQMRDSFGGYAIHIYRVDLP